jgi:FkbM family methyltransferase
MLIDESILNSLQDPRAYSLLRWQRFLANGFVPNVFYDIGANDPFSIEGQQVVYKPLMPQTQFFLFEAMAKHEEQLLRSNEPYVIAVLGEEEASDVIFYESKVFAPGTGDSYYLENTAAYAADAVVPTRHTTRRLDNVIEQCGWPLPDFMKLDTQGSELDILRGAPHCLAHARGVQIECNVLHYNQGAPLLPDVIVFMQAAGFRVYDILQQHFNQNRELLQVDLLFVRAELFNDQPFA